MKSDHRHELKTNELAEWLGNLPQWTKDNLKTIIGVSLLIAIVGTLYIWRKYTKDIVQVQERFEFTNLLKQLSDGKMQVIRAQQQGSDLSFILLQPANSLGTFAQDAKNDLAAALALIKKAEALRTELHYRPGTVSKQDLQTQINKAKAAYTMAIQRRLESAKGGSNPSLKAAAEFGLGLCEEELGNFEMAEQIYQDIAANAEFEGTITVAQAKHRLETMADYKQKVIFKPAPPPLLSPAPASPEASRGVGPEKVGAATAPTVQIKTVDTNMPAEANLPIEIKQASQTPNAPAEVKSEAPDVNDSVK